MPDITITAFNPDFSRGYQLFPIPAGADLALADVVCADPTSGALVKAVATDPARVQVIGLNTRKVLTNFTANAFRQGHAYIDGLTALDYGAKLWLSATAGKLTDTNPAASEIQTVTITGTPTGGTFTLAFRDQVTAGLAYNAATSAVQTALEGLSTIGAGNVAVTGSAGAYTVTFKGELADQALPLLVADGAALTGGSTPAVAVVETTPGAQGVLVAEIVPLWDRTPPSKMIAMRLDANG